MMFHCPLHRLEELQQSLNPIELQNEIRRDKEHNLIHDNDAQYALRQLYMGGINT